MVIIGVLIALLVAFGTFFNFSVSRKYVAKKLNRVLLARELSLSLATLACHQIRCHDIHEPTNPLRIELSRPLAEMSRNISAKVSFESALQPALQALLNSSSELHNLSYSIGWQISRDDFRPVLKAYPREKAGLIRIPVEISYSPPGVQEVITESYLYAVNIKVIANLVPVLSKFSLYVADARNGEAADRFNIVTTDKSGNLKGGNRPWVLNNGQTGSGKIPDRFSEIVASPRGLVYLGGGAVILANTRSWGTPGEFAEGFHLFKEGRGAAMYTVAWLGTTALINWEAGLCDDTSDSDSQLWLDLIKEGFEKEASHNSMFRLLGTENRRSPTLVMGDVYTRTQCCRIFKSSNKAFGPLPFAATQASFDKYKSGDDSKKDISFFISQVGNISLSYYNSNFASRLWELPYNRALGYIITDHRTPDPLTAKQIERSDPLADFISGEASLKRTSHNIPEPFNRIDNVGNDLRQMPAILKAMEIPGARAAATLEIKTGETLFKVLEREGYLKNGRLDLNCWLAVKSAEPLTISAPLQLVSHGGLVLEKGDIDINAEIKSPDGRFLLNLVTLDGDIRLGSGFSGSINAGLTAAGQVKVTGSAGSKVAAVSGNIAMKQIRAGSISDSMARGLDLNYDEKLAARPFNAKEEGSEMPLLTYGLEWHPYLIQ